MSNVDYADIPHTEYPNIVVPIHTNKGNIYLLETLRPLTILSWIGGKMFTSIVNDGLTAYVESNEPIFKAGFRKLTVFLTMYLYNICCLNTANTKRLNYFVHLLI